MVQPPWHPVSDILLLPNSLAIFQAHDINSHNRKFAEGCLSHLSIICSIGDGGRWNTLRSIKTFLFRSQVRLNHYSPLSTVSSTLFPVKSSKTKLVFFTPLRFSPTGEFHSLSNSSSIPPKRTAQYYCMLLTCYILLGNS